MESNFITGEAICEILEAININQKVIEFRIANQVGFYKFFFLEIGSIDILFKRQINGMEISMDNIQMNAWMGKICRFIANSFPWTVTG